MLRNSFSLITELEIVRKQKKRLQLEEARLSAPTLKKIELIPMLYEWFKNMPQNQFVGNCESVNMMKKRFLFIVMYLYSPVFLVGGKMAKGIRGMLAEVLQYESRCSISSLGADVWILYSNYKSFRDPVNESYDLIIEKLKKKGLIK